MMEKMVPQEMKETLEYKDQEVMTELRDLRDLKDQVDHKEIEEPMVTKE